MSPCSPRSHPLPVYTAREKVAFSKDSILEEICPVSEVPAHCCHVKEKGQNHNISVSFDVRLAESKRGLTLIPLFTPNLALHQKRAGLWGSCEQSGVCH